MRPGKLVVLASTVGLAGWLLWPRPAPQHLTPLERELGFRGAVRQIIQSDTTENANPRLGKQENRTVFSISRDGRRAVVKWNQKYTYKSGKVSHSGSTKTVEVTGTAGQEKMVERTQYSSDGQVNNTSSSETTFEDHCAVKSVTHSTGEFGNHTSTNEQTCDQYGRTLTDVSHGGERVQTRSSNWWLPAGIGIGQVWNAGFENRPATTHWGVQLEDGKGQSRMFSPLANVTTTQRLDSRGNWVWRKETLWPTPMSGNTVTTRAITYWNE